MGRDSNPRYAFDVNTLSRVLIVHTRDWVREYVVALASAPEASHVSVASRYQPRRGAEGCTPGEVGQDLVRFAARLASRAPRALAPQRTGASRSPRRSPVRVGTGRPPCIRHRPGHRNGHQKPVARCVNSGFASATRPDFGQPRPLVRPREPHCAPHLIDRRRQELAERR
jgi:hypothetical protein